MEYINIVVATDSKYVKYLGIMLISLFENFYSLEKRLIIHSIINDDVSDDEIKLLKMICDEHNVMVDFLKIDDSRYNHFFVSHHISKAAYYRISISDLLSQDIKKVIYLDSDIIIKGNIIDLWDIDLCGKIIGAVNDPVAKTRIVDLQIPVDCSYFNSGVLLINLEEWRKQLVTEKVLSYIMYSPLELTYHDQDALNAILYDKRLSIHPKWNVQTVMLQENCEHFFDKEEYWEAIRKPVIIHFTSASKPWHITNDHPLKNEFSYYLKKSLWKDTDYVSNSIKQMLLEKSKIFIFGTGSLAERFVKRTSISVNGFLDNNANKWGQVFYGKQIYSPEILNSIKKDNIGIIIVSSFYQEISNQLIEYGFKENEDFVWQL